MPSSQTSSRIWRQHHQLALQLQSAKIHPPTHTAFHTCNLIALALLAPALHSRCAEGQKGRDSEDEDSSGTETERMRTQERERERD
eukprot:2836913-Rhodomonas_salina.3